MKILAYDPFVTQLPEEFEGWVELCDMEKVIISCDILSVHIPLTPDHPLLSLDNVVACLTGGQMINQVV